MTVPKDKRIDLLLQLFLRQLMIIPHPKVFLNGQPDNSTITTSLFIYNQAFGGSYQYGKASAASIIMFLIIVFLSSILFYILRDKDEVELRKLIKQQEKEYKRKQKALN